MNARSVIDHALRVYYAEAAEPAAIARDLLEEYRAEILAERNAPTSSPLMEDPQLHALYSAMRREQAAGEHAWGTGDARRILRSAGYQTSRHYAATLLRALVHRGLLRVTGPTDRRRYELTTTTSTKATP